jgi:hypothetical protein
MTIEASEAGRRDFRRCGVFPSRMGKTRRRGGAIIGAAALCVALALVAAGGASATAAVAPEATEIYVGGGPEAAVVFKVHGGHVYVLAVGAVTYCSRTQPTEDRESSDFGFVAVPLPMRASELGLTAHERGVGEFGWRRIGVEAGFSGEKLIGGLNVFLGQESTRCQTGHYHGDGGSRIPFEAVRFVPIGSPSAAAPTAEETPIYFGETAGIEVFFAGNGHHVVARGASVSRCPAGGRGASRRSLFGELPVANKLGKGGKFHRDSTYLTRKGVSLRETGRMSGVDSPAAVTGSYRRETVLHPLTARATRCVDAPLRFHAVRYVAAVG